MSDAEHVALFQAYLQQQPEPVADPTVGAADLARARDPATPEGDLFELWESDSPALLQTLLRSPRCPETLLEMAFWEDSEGWRPGWCGSARRCSAWGSSLPS